MSLNCRQNTGRRNLTRFFYSNCRIIILFNGLTLNNQMFLLRSLPMFPPKHMNRFGFYLPNIQFGPYLPFIPIILLLHLLPLLLQNTNLLINQIIFLILILQLSVYLRYYLLLLQHLYYQHILLLLQHRISKLQISILLPKSIVLHQHILR